MRFRLALNPAAAASREGSTRASHSPVTRNPLAKRTLRRNADAILRGGARVHPESDLLSWRAAELTSARRRRSHAKSLRGIGRSLDRRALPCAAPLHRPGVRPYAAALANPADRVGDLSVAVEPRGILRLEDLLTYGDGPFYARENLSQLPDRLREIETALGRDGV